MNILFLPLAYIVAAPVVWLLFRNSRLSDYALRFCIVTLAILSVGIDVLSTANAVGRLSIRTLLAIGAAGAWTVLRKQAAPATQEPTYHDSRIWRLIASGYVFLVFWITLSLALAALPTTPDSMGYHLPRVEHWIQNHGVAFYDAFYEMQNVMAPFAEQLIMTLRLVSGMIRFDNLPQWFAMLGSCYAACLLTQLFSTRYTAHMAALVLMASLPMGILQSTSTQNDYVVAFFCLTGAYFLMDSIKKQNSGIIFSAISFALAVHTKGTAYVFGTGFALIACIWFVTKVRTDKKVWQRYLLAFLCFACIVSGHHIRNFLAYGNALGQESVSGVMVHSFSIPNFAANSLRQFLSNMPGLPSRQAEQIVAGISDLEARMGVNSENSDVFLGGMPFTLAPLKLITLEDLAPNTPHILLLTTLVVALLLFGRKARTQWRDANSGLLAVYGLALGISLFFFCLLIKWQPWITRLQLGLFVLSMPAAATVLTHWAGKKTLAFILAGCILFSLPFVFLNKTRLAIPFSYGGKNWSSTFFADEEQHLFISDPLSKDGTLPLLRFLEEHKPRYIALHISVSKLSEQHIWYAMHKISHENMPEIRNTALSSPCSDVDEILLINRDFDLLYNDEAQRCLHKIAVFPSATVYARSQNK